MDFDYVVEGSIFVSEEDLNEMTKQVKNGESAESIVREYISGFDDYEYYISDAYDYKIINEVRRRASLL